MRRTVLLMLTLGLAAIAAADTLGQLRDKSRVLLVFTPAAEDARMERQLGILQPHAAELAERDLVVIAVPETGVAPTEKKMDAAEALAVRRRFHVAADEFLAVLVGKDGGEKLRSQEPLSFERLREVIDAMPMRKEEMRKR